jgi:hypothetical protein
MNRPNLGRASTMSRRRILSLGVAAAGGFAGATIAGCTFPGGGVGGPLKSAEQSDSQFGNPRLFPSAFPTAIQRRIETIVDARGSIQGGVLQIEIDRDDIRDVKLRGTQIFPSFEINGALNFQSLGGNRVAMNSDLCLKSDELNPLIDQLLKHDIVFQAEHQHFYDFDPIVWFIHFRAVGDAETIARGCKAALNVTSTPFPQAPPKNPETPLPAAQIGKIIGATPSVGAKGVVSLQVPRADQIVLGGIHVNPYLNVSMPIAFQPLDGGRAAAVPDFGMVASEIQPLVRKMRDRDWDIGCLYNQETDEHPQLFFSHQFKTGDPIQLAREIREGLNLLNVKRS